MPLKTDYKNFIPSTTTKIFDIKQASDDTVINADVKFEDVTVYSQEGDSFGAADINATNTQVNANTDAVALKAPLSSPTFTGTPTAPTASTGTDTTQLATTAFVQQEVDVHKAENVQQSGGVHGLVVENGTWTPEVYTETTPITATYTIINGYYTRVGKLIKCNFFIRFTASGGSGHINITGLPFTAKRFYESGTIGLSKVGTTGLAFGGLVNNGSIDYFRIYKQDGSTIANASEINTGDTVDINGSITYEIE